MDPGDFLELCGLSDVDFQNTTDETEECSPFPLAHDAVQSSETAANFKPDYDSRAVGESNVATVVHAPSSNMHSLRLENVKAVVKGAVSELEASKFSLLQLGSDWSSSHVRISNETFLEHQDAFVLDGLLTDDECHAIIATAEASNKFSFWSAETSISGRDFRDADTIEMHHPAMAEEIWLRIKPFLQQLHAQTLSISEDDTPRRWERDIAGCWDARGTNTCLLVSRYKAGGHFAPHTDGYSVVHLNHRSM
jgi:hypothetical protein